MAHHVTVDPSEVGLDATGLAALDADIQNNIDNGRSYGATILVARGGKIAHRKTFGTVAPGRPAAVDDIYFLMSMSKAFTAVLAHRAIDNGQFTLDTRIADILPRYGNGGKEAGTMRQLINHTAGLPAAPVAPPLPIQKMGHLEERARAIEKLKAAYAPGEKCVYTSGTGYDLLGEIIVETDPKHRAFRDIAREEIFEPLGMADTSFGHSTTDPRRVPVSHTPKSMMPVSGKVDEIFNDLGPQREYPCAGGFSTVDDLFTFTEALNGRYPECAPEGYRLMPESELAEAKKNSTGDLILEALMVDNKLLQARQMLGTFGVKGLIDTAKGAKVADPSVGEDPEPFPARFTLLGGYNRDTHEGLTPLGQDASPSAIGAVGGGSTMWMTDPEKDLTFIFLSAGLIEGFDHFRRLSGHADLAIASITA